MATTASVNPQILAKATILRQLGVKPGDGLPSWARQNARSVDLVTSPYWGPQQAGDGQGTLGNGDGSGFYQPLQQFAAGYDGSGDGQYMSRAPDPAGAMEFLRTSGQTLMEASQGQNIARWLQDASGKITAKPEISTIDDSAFWTAAQLASSVVGGAVGGNAGGALVGASNAAGNAGVETGNFSSMLKAALLAAGTSYVGNAASAASGLTGAAGNAVGGAVGSGIAAAAKGGNLSETLKAAIIGAAPGATGAALNDNKALSPVLAGLVKNIVGSAVNKRAPSTSPGSIAALLSTMIPKQSGG
jgi:hypothetical protein